MNSNIKTTKKLALYSLLIGAVYLAFGLLEFTRGFSESFNIPWEFSTVLVYPDMFSGITLAIIGLVFLFGVKGQWKNGKDAASYLMVGTLIAAVFCAVYLAIMGAHALGSAIYQVSSEPYADIFADWAEWASIDDMRAGIWLFAFVIPGAYFTLKTWLSRKRLK
jgi:multisubunit Na+/H+ antiporter MnhG subunit